jgi:hypothetical protein
MSAARGERGNVAGATGRGAGAGGTSGLGASRRLATNQPIRTLGASPITMPTSTEPRCIVDSISLGSVGLSSVSTPRGRRLGLKTGMGEVTG